MNIVTALAGLKTAKELTTGIRDALKSREVKLDEVVARLIEVLDLITDGRTALIDAQEEISNKNREIQGLKDELQSLQLQKESKPTAIFHDGGQWQKLADGSEDGPFCPGCWSEKRLQRGQVNSVEGNVVEFFCNHRLHKNPFLFRVPRELVKGVDLSSYDDDGPGFAIIPMR